MNFEKKEQANGDTTKHEVQQHNHQHHDMLRAVLADLSGTEDAVDIVSLDLSRVQSHLALATKLNGHAGSELRRLSKHSSSTIGKLLEQLRRAVARIADGDSHEAVDALAQIAIPESVRSVLDAEVSEYAVTQYAAALEIAGDADIEYEQLLAQRTAHALGIDDERPKWNTMIGKVFDAADQKQVLVTVLEQVGSLPDQLLDRRKFKTKYEHDPSPVVRAVQSLRAIESDESKDESTRTRARFERSKLLNYMINQGVAETIRETKHELPNITLDTNGVFVRLRGFESHIPYGLVDQKTIDFFEDSVRSRSQNSWVTQEQLTEIAIQRARENNDIGKRQAVQAEQQLRFEAVVAQHIPEMVTSGASVAEYAAANPEKVVAVLVDNDLVLPDQIIVDMVGSHDARNVFAAVKLGELLGQRLLQQIVDHEDIDFFAKNLDEVERLSRESRTRLLNDPRHFSAMKIVRELLKQQPQPDDAHFALLAGKAKQLRKRKTTYTRTYIDALHEGATARILINEEKHLNPRLRARLDELIQVPVELYPKVAQKAQTLHYFGHVIDELQHYADLQSVSFSDIESYCRDVEYYLTADFSREPGHYQEAHQLIAKMRETTAVSGVQIRELTMVLAQAHERFADYLYSVINNPEHIEQHFNPSITAIEVSYTSADFELLRERVAQLREQSGVPVVEEFDERLYEGMNSPRIPMAVMDHPLESRSDTVPHNVLLKHLEMIGIRPDRPMISVLGGCRNLDGDGGLQRYAQSVVEVAMDVKANVAIPPLQSGMPVLMAQSYRVMQERYDATDMPEDERAHMFTVAPGPNLIFDGNPYTTPEALQSQVVNEPEVHLYGIVPVPALITPPDGEWWRQGYDKLDSPYFVQIAYQSSMYEITSRNQPDVTLLGNGGYYTLIEMSQQLARGFNHLIIKDTGRLSEHLAEVIEHMDEFDFDDIELVTKEDFLDTAQDEKLQALYDQIFDIIEQSDITQEVRDEFFAKDFGSARTLSDLAGSLDPKKIEDYEVNRKMFVKVLKQAQVHKDQVRVTTLAALKDDLRDCLRSQSKK